MKIILKLYLFSILEHSKAYIDFYTVSWLKYFRSHDIRLEMHIDTYKSLIICISKDSNFFCKDMHS